MSDQKLERNTCFDLLDALTKSGCVPIDGATLHIVMCATHCFTDNIMNTLVKDNVNPIEKVERSALIVASTIHRKASKHRLSGFLAFSHLVSQTPAELVKAAELDRVKAASPGLFVDN